ncbi:MULTISPECIES: dienelactone hydrolase family protein [unclassified Novosphingobium]|uniref:dienelactone hydrolase family protein n=1 Tax=unclassified Novosphingobium TaxID=2644732 RepID=UPI0006C85678|nr:MULTISPECIES: dienelactone hydrolase family protein [unclassified Novosphingobium]KPH57442.1 carboxymethylenebutenolidase [Novosphingobium sp. ST904]MPS67445.1 dienelactone hydrolase family protein [Novosphingobium sp.]TCM42981.1 carboxymethylenebutenolidase [Novosphingobium sp. ST904]
MTNTDIPTLDGDGMIPAYIARPEGTPRGAIIVQQEIFGVDAGIRQKADSWAAKGYLTVAPDTFWRQKPGIELSPYVEEEFNQAIGHMMAHDFDLGIRDLEAVIHWIRREEGVPKIGLVGFCMGGRIAYMVAARTDIDASVGYYGVMIDQMLNEKHAIARPLMLHIPTADHFVDAAAQKAIHEGLDDHPRVTLWDYEGLDHGFAAEIGARRDEAGAALADGRTEAFFAEHIG